LNFVVVEYDLADGHIEMPKRIKPFHASKKLFMKTLPFILCMGGKDESAAARLWRKEIYHETSRQIKSF
jgi:hypothetical protein